MADEPLDVRRPAGLVDQVDGRALAGPDGDLDGRFRRDPVMIDQVIAHLFADHVDQPLGHLSSSGRLNASILLRALAHGHMTFFEWGIAELANVPHHRTWLMIHDAGPLGLRAIYDRAGLPGRLFPAFRVAVDTFHSMEFDGGASDHRRFQERMLERFLTQPTPAPREDLDYLLDKMDKTARAQQQTRIPDVMADAG